MVEAIAVIDKSPHTIRRMFAAIAPRYDRANRILSMRFDVGWRKHVARNLLPARARVLDLAAGTGDLTIDLARYGNHRVVSADFTFEMLAHGAPKIRAHAPGARQLCADALALPFGSERFDGATVAFGVRNFADPLAGLREIVRVLSRGGVVGILEFSRPAPLVNLVYDSYFSKILPRLGGLITGSGTPYRYLAQSVHEFPEGDRFLELMRSAGLGSLTATRLSAGIVTFYRGVKP